MTVPGRFGALASKLMQVIEGTAHQKRIEGLSSEDLYRLTCWLDCNSDFYGAYEDIQTQARGGRVQPLLE